LPNIPTLSEIFSKIFQSQRHGERNQRRHTETNKCNYLRGKDTTEDGEAPDNEDKIPRLIDEN
jgi:hypothetical protein